MKPKNIVLNFSSNQNSFAIEVKSDNNSCLISHTFSKDALLTSYQAWRNEWDGYIKFKRLSSRYNRAGGSKEKNDKNKRTLEEQHEFCANNHNQLLNCLDEVLKDNSNFFKQSLSTLFDGNEDSVRIICQFNSSESDLASIPWDHWEGWNDLYNQKDLIVSLSTETSVRTYKPQPQTSPLLDNIEILVILGEYEDDENNIDLKADFKEFKSLEENLEKRANIKITLSKPNNLEELKTILQEKNWSIIYYGGHSRAIGNDVELELRKGVKVKISQLSDVFEKIAGQGFLKIIIFNSCQSVNTALQLLPLGVPTVIAMRESIADFHAHYYVRYLLESFVIGLPLKYAVEHCKPYLRAAYDQLIDIPGANILPALCVTPEAVGQLDFPVIPQPKLNQISFDMLALCNLARCRLAVAGYSEKSDLTIQEELHEQIKTAYASKLSIKNEIKSEEDKTILSFNMLRCSDPVMWGQCIWEITFLANVEGIEKSIIWGKGFVNIKNGNSELLLDHRPESWYGESIKDRNGITITALTLDKNEIHSEINGKLSLTKYALYQLEQKYREYAIKNQSTSRSNVKVEAYNVSNFCGWLKDVNKKVYIINFCKLVIEKAKALGTEGTKWIENIEVLSKEESSDILSISNEAYNKTPFAKARNDLGITEFKITRTNFIPFSEFIKNHKWTSEDLEKIGDNEFIIPWLDKLKVPDVLIVYEAKKPE